MKKIAVLTRDCAGVNATIRSIVRTANNYGINIVGIRHGYRGLIDNDIVDLDRKAVSGIITLGGTILKTSRCKRFYNDYAQKIAAENIRINQIDGLIVVGGNGSFTGAHLLATKFNIPVIGIPATIDNDVNNVDLSIGADTAVNVALDALDKIRDTATSLERIFIVEVMGRSCGYIALQVGLAGGCEEVLVPELDTDIEVVCKEIKKGNDLGKASWIIIVAEGKAHANDVADVITKKTDLETRVAVLGHIQRGGRPTATDRILGAQLGNFAVEALKEGITDHCVCINNDKPMTIPLGTAIKPKQIDVYSKYKLIKVLT